MEELEKRRLGRTGLSVTRLGYGAGPAGIEELPFGEFEAALESALEMGINLIDTARLYGPSESFIGRVIARRRGERGRFHLISKTISRTKRGALEDIHRSLEHLQTDRIELYLLHDLDLPGWAQAMGPGGALEGLREARGEGLIESIGFSCHDMRIITRAIECGEIEAAMLAYNPFSRETEEFISLAHRRDMGVIIMKPLGGPGMLDSLRIAECETIIEPKGLLRYVLSNPRVTSAIPGMRFAWEVRGNAELARSYEPMSDEERRGYEEEADTLLTRIGSDYCRGCDYCIRSEDGERGCEAGIDIPKILVEYYNVARAFLYKLKELQDHYREYAESNPTILDCTECGTCETKCPYNIPIVERLRGTHDLLTG